jgi:hypothetical protein
VTFTYTMLVTTIFYVASYVVSNVKLMLNKCKEMVNQHQIFKKWRYFIKVSMLWNDPKKGILTQCYLTPKDQTHFLHFPSLKHLYPLPLFPFLSTCLLDNFFLLKCTKEFICFTTTTEMECNLLAWITMGP